MANHKSALKRIKQSEKRNLLNRSRRSRIKTLVKEFMTAVETNDPAAQEKFKLTQKIIQQTAAKGTLHKRAASRKISRLAQKLNKIAIAPNA